MLMHIRSVVLVSRKFTIALVHLMALGVIIIPLAGCSDDGTGGPNISSLSTPTGTPQSAGAQSDTPAAEVAANGQDDPTISMTSEEPGIPEEDSDAPVTDLEGEDPTISVASTPTGATARLTWDASADPNVQGYFIHYGKRSSGEHASCSYEESQRVGAPPATITGLEPNTAYYFAISAFGESESEAETPCSNEVLVVTPAQG